MWKLEAVNKYKIQIYKEGRKKTNNKSYDHKTIEIKRTMTIILRFNNLYFILLL